MIFLTADAYGVMPPISKLNEKQAMYYFVSGFTSKLAGTERGITSPVPTFSTCFGAPFMPLDPSVYAGMLAEKVAKSGANVYLVNTGWCGNSGKRMNLKYTRAMVTAALNGELEKAEFVTDPYFGVQVPTSCPGVPDEQMIPAKQWGTTPPVTRPRPRSWPSPLWRTSRSTPICLPMWWQPAPRPSKAGRTLWGRICGAPFL